MKKIFFKIEDFKFLLIIPATWYIFLNFGKVIGEWLKTPMYLVRKLTSIFLLDKLRFILELRGENLIISRIFFNKITLLLNNFSDFLSYISPKYYFADRTVFFKVEAIPFFLFPLWIFGILNLMKHKRINLILFLILFCFLAFILDQKNLFFLFPAIFMNLLIVNQGIKVVFNKKTVQLKWFLSFWLIYDIYLLGLLMQ